MPIRRRRQLVQQMTSSPYSVPIQQNTNFGNNGSKFTTRGYRRQQRQRHSSWTIQEDCVKEFIPTSMSENGPHGLATGGSCMSLCGMFEGEPDMTSPGYQNLTKDKYDPHSSPGQSLRQLSSRSRCNSMPVDVPLRKNAGKTKRSRNSKKSRSSGGYFFDKYIKRFRAKRSQSIGSDDSSSSDSSQESLIGSEMRSSRLFTNNPASKFRSNRQDMLIISSGVEGQIMYCPLDEKYDVFSNEEVCCDELYPKRYGTSSEWSSCPLNPTISSIKTETQDYVPYSPQILPLYHVPVSPVSPPPGTIFSPVYWDENPTGFQDYEVANTPVTNLLSEFYEANRANHEVGDDTLKALEQLYWCNFRVTSDGDWLSLKELEDDTHLHNMNDASTPSPTSSTSSTTIEQMRIERKNLLGMARLSIKGLIESSLSAGHTLDSDHAPLQQFFIIMEAVLKHGLKAPKLFTGHKLFWGPLEAIEKVRSEAAEITNSVRDLPGIKTHAGRARAWLRLALMQKRLADYFRTMVENRDAMREFYEPESLVLSEEGIVLSGHLVGLNCIDANLCMKGDDLDNQNAVIDYSLYIKEGNRPSIGTEIELAEKEREKEENAKKEKQESPEEIMREMADQKNYLEERNRYLETTLSELQKRAGHTSSSNQLLEAELEAAKLTLATMRGERKKLLDEKETMAASHKKTLEDRQSDLDLERQTLVQSRAGLDEMLNQVKKQLKQEALMRMEVERELELQIGLKQEIEVAMKLLEKDIYDKQDSLVILREQLDNVKGINIDIYKKLQDKTDTIESKTKQITELEEETKRLNAEAGKLKEKFCSELERVDLRRVELGLT
ncbi:protein RUFY3-like isoform X4 [Styela clava]